MNIKGQFFLLQKEVNMVLDKLTDAQSGKLFKLIAAYVNFDNNEEFEKRVSAESVTVQVAFLPIRATIDRNENKYRLVQSRKSDGGRKSGEVRRHKKTLKQTETKTLQDSSPETNTLEDSSLKTKSREHNRSISISRSITQSVCENARTEDSTSSDPEREGDEAHRELKTCPLLRGLSWEQDRTVRHFYAAAPVSIDWPALARTAATAATLMSSIDNPAMFWKAQVERHVRNILGPVVSKFEEKKTGGMPLAVWRGAAAEDGDEED